MPYVDKECVTHHYACNCREEKFKQILIIAKKALRYYAEDPGDAVAKVALEDIQKIKL